MRPTKSRLTLQQGLFYTDITVIDLPNFQLLSNVIIFDQRLQCQFLRSQIEQQTCKFILNSADYSTSISYTAG